MEVRLLDDRDRWDAWVLGSQMGNLLQSYDWGEFKARFGWHPVRILVEDAGEPVAGLQVLLRHLPFGTVAYAPRAPVAVFSNSAYLDALLGEVHAKARLSGAIFLKIEPEMRSSSFLESALLNRGFVASGCVQPRSTIILDLRPDLTTLMGKLNRQTRYNIRLAGRRGLTIRQGTADDIDRFYCLLVETSQRSGFAIHSLEYYRTMWRTFGDREMIALVMAELDGEPLAAALMLTAGRRAYYLYAASSGKHRNLKPNDLLQWECIKLAKSQGCLSYDLWGIPDAIGEAVEQGVDPEASSASQAKCYAHDMWGVYQFKRGFGGQIVRYASAYDYVYSRARYWLYLASVRGTRPALAWPQRALSPGSLGA